MADLLLGVFARRAALAIAIERAGDRLVVRAETPTAFGRWRPSGVSPAARAFVAQVIDKPFSDETLETLIYGLGAQPSARSPAPSDRKDPGNPQE